MAFAILDELRTFGPDHCRVLTYEQAADYTRRLTRTHYENFTVVSWFLPKRLRDDFAHVYAFCRWADDLGDEVGDPRRAVELLEWWRRELDRCYGGEPRHPVFVALRPTIRKHDIPRKPFDDLIDAFLQDQRVSRYDTWDAVVDYCTRSADPVGRLVLYLCGHREPDMQALSDATCTALQLTNFWQDVRRDIIERDRVYVPSEIAGRHGLSIEQMVAAVKIDAGADRAAACAACPDPIAMTALRPAFTATCRDLVERTRPLFATGRRLWPMLEPDVRLDVKLFTLGGESVLGLIEKRGYDTLSGRPRLGRAARVMLMLRGFAGKLTSA